MFSDVNRSDEQLVELCAEKELTTGNILLKKRGIHIVYKVE